VEQRENYITAKSFLALQGLNEGLNNWKYELSTDFIFYTCEILLLNIYMKNTKAYIE